MIDGYEDQVQNIGDAPIYSTVAGEPVPFVEPLLSNLQVKVIRSTKCSFRGGSRGRQISHATNVKIANLVEILNI